MSCYNIRIKRKNEYKTSKWSGGTTTELLIYPGDAVYNQRNFIWRLSSAKVEDEASTFTILKGFSRIIMILEGELNLEHVGHHKTILRQFEQDSFCGDWTTKSLGKVTDFNLMMAKGCTGKMEAIKAEKYSSLNIVSSIPSDKIENCTSITEVFYCSHGNVELIISGTEKITLNQGDLIYITLNPSDANYNLTITNLSQYQSVLIKSTIYE